MTATAGKLRGLFLTALLVGAAVGGVVTVSGVAAASGNDVGITSAVEADGTVETRFNASSFSDPPEAADVDLWVDGRRVIDDGASDATLGGATWTITGFSTTGSAATFTVQTDGSSRDIAANRNLTVEFEGVARPSATNTDPEAEVTVTQAVVTEGGGADSVANAQRIYRGGDIAIEAVDADTDVFLNSTGQDLSTGADSRAITLVTTNSQYATGEVTEVEFDGDPDNTQYFRLRDLGLTATARNTAIDDETALRADVSALRGGSPFTATLLDGSDTTVDTITRDLSGDGEDTIDFGTQSAGSGPYTVRVVDNETTATATTADISVSSTGGGDDEADEERGGGGDDAAEVYYDPAAIRGLVDLPDSVRPIAAERGTVGVTPERGGEAEFVGRTAVESVRFDEYVTGEVVVADVDGVERATAPLPGRVLVATRLAVPDGATGAETTIRMRVPDAVRDAVGANASALQLVRFADGEWAGLDTAVHARADDETVLEAEMRPSSYVAVRARGVPTASVDASAATVTPGEPVVLDGSDSNTTNGDLVAYEWSVDGRTLDGATTAVTFDDPGTYTVDLLVTNDVGATATATTTVTVEEGATDAETVTATRTATPPGATPTRTERPTTRSDSSTTAPRTATPATADGVATTTASGPGFGSLLSVAALAAVVLFARRAT